MLQMGMRSDLDHFHSARHPGVAGDDLLSIYFGDITITFGDNDDR